MVAKPVILDSFQWPTQSAAESAYKAILHDSRYSPYAPITDETHQRMLLELVERHPESAKKIGAGIDHFFIGRTADGDRKYVKKDATGIWIKRVDGSTVDFGYRTAITGSSVIVDVKEALRIAVEDRHRSYRDARYQDGHTVTSDISGLPIRLKEDAQVVYMTPSWAELTDNFVTSEGGWNNIRVVGGGDGVQIGGRLADEQLKTRWLDFHAEHSVLGLATSHEAVSRPKKQKGGWQPR